MNRSLLLIGAASVFLATACARQEAGSTDTADETAPAVEQPGTTTEYGTESTTPADPNATVTPPPADSTTPPADTAEPGAATTTPPQ